MKLSWRGALPLVGLLACVGDDPVGGDAGSDAGAPPTDAAVTPQDAATTPDTAAPPTDGSPTDDGGPTGRCDPTKEFGTPVLMAGLNSGENETGFTMTRDELTAVISRTDPATGSDILLQATRTNIDAPFGSPTDTNVSALNSVQGQESAPSISPDGLLLYFVRNSFEPVIQVAARSTASSAFTTSKPVMADGAAIGRFPSHPKHAQGGRALYWEELDPRQVRFATIGGDPGQLSGTRTIASYLTINATLTPNALGIYYGTSTDIRNTDRPSTSAPFAQALFPNTVLSAGSANDQPLHISSDNCVMVLKSDRPGGLGGFDLYMAKRPR